MIGNALLMHFASRDGREMNRGKDSADTVTNCNRSRSRRHRRVFLPPWKIMAPNDRRAAHCGNHAHWRHAGLGGRQQLNRNAQLNSIASFTRHIAPSVPNTMLKISRPKISTVQHLSFAQRSYHSSKVARGRTTTRPQHRAATANEFCMASIKCKSNTDGI
ncbi:hypothetical protein [Bradyrhizobium prioriisuperbiae]|uniref:hypothetical protein n=1 Tax=Bradyrhizobium prioriisuperbiae TaxID=2854389 RepID=UPI0028E55B06|nr:hypothetical protein [Bradyrhizobium prioritasuperba]